MSRDLYQRIKASCFPAGTPVATADGLRAIETIRPDEQVWGLDLATGRWQLCRVLEAHRRAYAGPFVAIALGPDTIESTSNHPYWVVRGDSLAERPWPEDVPLSATIPSIPGRWVEACNLRIGDVLLLKPDREAAVKGLSARWVQQEVYNLHIADVQCYAAGTAQVLVHNTNYAPTAPVPGAPGSASHRAARWQEYLDSFKPGGSRAGKTPWSQERWDRYYDLNMTRPTVANQPVLDYHGQLGWGRRQVDVATDLGTRRLDIADVTGRRGVEVKSGYIRMSPELRSQINRDAWLVQRGWDIEHHFAPGSRASQGYLDAWGRKGT
jgi:hypothetical protein